MAIPHARPDDIIDLFASPPANERQGNDFSTSLIRTPRMQLLRLVLNAGQTLPVHDVPVEITIQCLDGMVVVATPDKSLELSTGKLVMLPASEPHSVEALKDALLLVTLLH